MSLENKSPKNTEIPVAQFIAVLVLSISIFLIVDFGRRAATGYRVRREEQKLQAQLEALNETNKALESRRAYVETDLYVAEVARNEFKWSTPDETVIVILATPEAAPLSSFRNNQNVPSNVDSEDTPFNAWLTLFFPDLEKR